MSIANFRKNIRASNTRLGTLNNQLENKEYEVAEDVAGADRIKAVQKRVNELNGDNIKLKRGIDNLNEWSAKYAEYVDEVEPNDQQAAEQSMEDFFAAEATGATETKAQNIIDEINVKVVALEAELVDLRVNRVQRNVVDGGERVQAAEPSIKLSDIDLEIFTGDYSKWLPWWQAFESLVHKKSYDKNIKYRYLLKYTKGRAKRAISGMAITNETYDDAVRTLKSRFGDDTLVVNALSMKLTQLPKASDSVIDVRRLLDSVQDTITQLKQLKEETNVTQNQLVILQRLPEWARLKALQAKIDYEKANPGQKWNTDKLLTCLNDMLTLRETSNDIANAGNPPSNSHTTKNDFSDRQNFRRNNFKTRFANAAVNAAAVNITKGAKCVLCEKSGHFPSECREFRSFSERVQRLKDKNLCSKCLRNGHSFTDCNSKLKCGKCKKDGHHACFCHENFKNQKRVKFQKTDRRENDESNKQENVERVPYRRPSGNVVSPAVIQHKKVDQVEEVVLAFVNINVANPNIPTKKAQAPTFLDVGASFSFILQSFADELKLSLFKRVNLSIRVFDDSSAKSKFIIVTN